MLCEFSIIPVGAGSSISKHITKVLRIVDSSGLTYKINPMGTVIEGEWNEVMKLISKCHKAVLKDVERAITTVRIDDKKGSSNMMVQKVKSVERKMGKPLKK